MSDPSVPEGSKQPKLHPEEMFEKSDAMANIRRSYGDLQGTELKVCLLSLSIFPENSVIRKRPLIYWWIGEGFISSTREKTAEEIGEDIFSKLMRKELIQPQPGETNCELLVKNCIVHPCIRRMLICLARDARLFNFDSTWPMMPTYSVPTCRRSCLVSKEKPAPQDKLIPEDKPVIAQDKDKPVIPVIPQDADQLSPTTLTVFNVNVQYLNLKQEWLEKFKRVEVLHFGRWQSSPEHHIEVVQKTFDGSQAVSFLNGLGAQKHLKYLSLRGISRISGLPASISSLISLEILDLRACHDLEKLPSDISSLKKLTHLDVSECYLLEGMPKGLDKLSSLQVLKGFLIGSQEKAPTKLVDLESLKKLRRLSIHFGNGAAVQPDAFKKLKDMSSLRILKVSWGVVSKTEEFSKLSFPKNLEKLDLQGFPLPDAPEGLKPSELQKLKKLYIRGGKLERWVNGDDAEKWKVEILRLKFLNFRMESADLERRFPQLKYLRWDPKKLSSKAEG